MFTAIAGRYDLNNTLLSFGLHYWWKQRAITSVPSFADGWAIDLGAGTADLALLLGRRMGSTSRVVAVDLNAAMLQEGARKIRRKGFSGRLICLQANGEWLSFRENSVDVVTAGFCIRNVGNREQVFAEVRRVLKPGGRFVCLEFSRPARGWLGTLYDWYSFRLLPWVGTAVARDTTGVYHYLPTSIRAFPDQEGVTKALEETGFRQVEWRNLTGGIAVIHMAIK